MSDEESWREEDTAGAAESEGLISDVLCFLNQENSGGFTDLYPQFPPLGEESDLSLAEKLDHPELFTEDYPPGFDSPYQFPEYPSVDATSSAGLCGRNGYQDRSYPSGSNDVDTLGNGTSEAVRFLAEGVDEAGCVDVSNLHDGNLLELNTPNELPRSDKDVEELRELSSSASSSGTSLEGGGRYSAKSKGKWKEKSNVVDLPEDVHPPRESIERPIAETSSAWAKHNSPFLQAYAERQTNPPLGKRVNVELSDATQFVTGVFQMSANRDGDNAKGKKGQSKNQAPEVTNTLLDGFVNIQRWAKEYMRARFGLEVVGDLVPTLLVTIVNSFYETQMVLLDNIVSNALELKAARMGSTLEVSDFSFGFDLKMTQELPFLVEASCRFRETIANKQAKVPAEPVLQMSSKGRVIKPRKLGDTSAVEGGLMVTPAPARSVQRKKRAARRVPKKPPKVRAEIEVEVAALSFDYSENHESGSETMLNSPADTLIALDVFEDDKGSLEEADGTVGGSAAIDLANTSTCGGTAEEPSNPPPAMSLYRRYSTRTIGRSSSVSAPRLTLRVPRRKLSANAARLSPLSQLSVSAIPDPEEPGGLTQSISDTGRSRKKRRREED